MQDGHMDTLLQDVKITDDESGECLHQIDIGRISTMKTVKKWELQYVLFLLCHYSFQ